MVAIVVSNGDILSRPCDLLILKHANGFHGVDQAVSAEIGFDGHVPNGEHVILHGKNIEARKVLYIGVGPLNTFRYEHIRNFAHQALEIAGRTKGEIRTICTPLHGPGYGLDETEAFFSLIGGFLDAIRAGVYPSDLEKIEIVEAVSSRATRLEKLLRSKLASASKEAGRTARSARPNTIRPSDVTDLRNTARIQKELASYGAESEHKPKLFVAMPFNEDFSDEWEIAIQEASAHAGIVSERIDKTAYVGDVVSQIKKRISEYDGLLALLNEHNPNVFLEIGFAWAKGKPTILMMRKGNDLPFDVQGQKCLIYKSINDLRTQLREELAGLKKAGVFETT